MSPETLEVLARAQQRQVADTYRIFGQADDVDEPEILHHLPLEGLLRLAGRGFEQLAIVLALFLVVGLSLSGGTTP